VLAMLLIALIPLLTPKVKAVSTITLLDPTSGFVGTLLKVEGTIDTLNGTYIIRWNQALNVTMGSAIGYNVSTSFIVPSTVGAPAPSGRDIPVELIDNATQTVGTAYFKLFTKFYIKADKPSPPRQLQEGETTKIWLNVTGGEANTAYTANVSVTDSSGINYPVPALVPLSNTTTIGYGEANATYPNNFGINAHTNNTGTYHVLFNETLATDDFTIGITDKLEYSLNETVLVQATGYGSLEIATADIKVGGISVATFPKNFTADTGGVVTFSWKIPLGSTLGIYNLTLTNATSLGTVKTPRDTQTFEVLGFTCQIQTVNLANQPFASAVVNVYDAATNTFLNLTKLTNSSGWVLFTLNSGNYTFRASWKNVEVGLLSNVTFSQNMVLTLELKLTHMRIVVEDITQKRLSLIDLKLKTQYEVKSFRTNATGTWEIHNLFVNMSYVVEAKRYNLLLPMTPIQDKTLSVPWNNITIRVPTYTLLVQVFDSHHTPARDLDVVAYEWSSGTSEPAQSQATTDDGGNATLSLTFGKYRLRLYKDTMFLNDVEVDVAQNPTYLPIYSEVYNVDLHVLILDYFGQPIPNVLVVFERKINSSFQTAENQTTGADGVARFKGIIGGDSRVSVYIGGKQSETQYLYLVGPTKDTVFKMDRYMAIFGYTLETSLFVTVVTLLILVAIFIITLSYKRLLRLLQRPKK